MEQSVTLTESDVEELIEQVDREAASHGGDYAAGMRRARLIVEESLKEDLRESGMATIDVILDR